MACSLMKDLMEAFVRSPWLRPLLLWHLSGEHRLLQSQETGQQNNNLNT